MCEVRYRGSKKIRKWFRNILWVCVFFVATYGSEVISVDSDIKKTDLRNCLRLSKHCTKPTFENRIRPKKDQITATTAMAAVAAADEHY